MNYILPLYVVTTLGVREMCVHIDLPFPECPYPNVCVMHKFYSIREKTHILQMKDLTFLVPLRPFIGSLLTEINGFIFF